MSSKLGKILIILSILVLILLLIPLIVIIITGLFDGNTCSVESLESVKSQDGNYIINTYLHNCHATVDFSVTAELCDRKKKCKEIYDVYHEKDSFVYWIDKENIFINGKKLNIYKDTYSWHNEDNYEDKLFKLYPNHDFKIYIINQENESYQISEEEVEYIIEMMKKYKFSNDKQINQDYHYRLKIVNLNMTIENNTEEYELLISNDNRISITQKNKYIELNRTDTEFIKKILKEID